MRRRRGAGQRFLIKLTTSSGSNGGVGSNVKSSEFDFASSMATRRTVTNRSGGGPRTRAFDADDHQVVESPDQNAEEEESTDKETRLTLMEEVLLLGLKDREVRSGFLQKSTLLVVPVYINFYLKIKCIVK